MNKNLIKVCGLAVSAAMLMSGCLPEPPSREKPNYYTSGGDSYIPPTTTTSIGLNIEPNIIGTGSDGVPEGRGTQLIFHDWELAIERLKREDETAMGSDEIWTVFVYMCGTDLETRGGMATYDLAEMQEAAMECPQLRFVVEAGGAAEWSNSVCEDGKSQRFIIEGEQVNVLESGSSRNMGKAETLADFISWGVKNYASRYMVLDLWDHGGGSISGVCFDELYNSDSLTLGEIDAALASVYGEMTDRFELIGFDACLMATVETANLLVPYARYMVGSQNLEPGSGWNYVAFANAVNGGAKNGGELGKFLCDGFYDDCVDYGVEDSATLSVIDLSKMDAFITAFNDYAKGVYDYASDGGTTDVIKAAKQALNFGGNNRAEGYTNMVDLMDLIRFTGSYSAGSSTAMQRLDECVIYMRNNPCYSDAGGLNVYYPLSVQGSKELDIFRNICVSPYYISLVDLCAYGSDKNGYTDGFDFEGWLTNDSGFWGGLFDWSNSSYDYWNNQYDNNLNFDYSDTAITFIDEPQLIDDGYYYFRLTEDSLYDLDTVYCNIAMSYWDSVDNCEYMLDLGTDDYVDMNWDTGECYDAFDGYWFALPDGQPLCVYLTDTLINYDTGEYYNLYTAPMYVNDEFTYLRIKQSYYGNGMTTEILGIWNGIDESGSASRDLYQLQVGDVLYPCYPAYDPYTGEYVMDFYGFEYVYDGNTQIGEDMLYEGDYYYAFEIYDLYDNVLYTDFVLLGFDEDGTIYYYTE